MGFHISLFKLCPALALHPVITVEEGHPQARVYFLSLSSPAGSHAPVYFYEFQHRPNFFKDSKPPHVKADHGDEILFLFRSFWGGTQGE